MNNATINADVTMAGDGGQSLLANRYRVVRQLGQGGMGSVWLAEDTVLDNRKVAIKMLPSILFANKRAYNQLKSEALVAMKLSHPNIAAVRSFEENDGNPFIVEDYIEGQTLDNFLAEKGGTLTEDEMRKLLAPVAAALDYAHGKGVVHRDVKPGNVMIATDGTPFVLDFGIAREAQETMTMVTGKLSSGTLLYMGPEQLRGQAPTPAQDVYSFAAMVYECLTGHPPFFRGAIEDQIKNEQPPPLDTHIAICERVIAGLAKDPVSRPATCVAVLTPGRVPFREQSTNPDRAAPEPQVVARTMPASRMMLSLVVILSLLLFAMLGGFFAWWILDREGSDVSTRSASTVVARGGSVQEVASDLVDAQALFSLSAPIAEPTEEEKDGVSQLSQRERFQNELDTWLPLWHGFEIQQRVAAAAIKTCETMKGVTNDELYRILSNVEIEPLPNSPVIALTVRAKDSLVAKTLADVYVGVIRCYVDEECQHRSERKLQDISKNVETMKKECDELSQAISQFRIENGKLCSARDVLKQSITKTAGNILELEEQCSQLTEWKKCLEYSMTNLWSIGSIKTSAPRGQEVAEAYKIYQESIYELESKRIVFSDAHPDVITARKSCEASERNVIEAVQRALVTCTASIQAKQNEVKALQERLASMRSKLSETEQKIVIFESGLAKLESELKIREAYCEKLLSVEVDLRREFALQSVSVTVVQAAEVKR